jgi:hypothetical protein
MRKIAAWLLAALFVGPVFAQGAPLFGGLAPEAQASAQQASILANKRQSPWSTSYLVAIDPAALNSNVMTVWLRGKEYTFTGKPIVRKDGSISWGGRVGKDSSTSVGLMWAEGKLSGEIILPGVFYSVSGYSAGKAVLTETPLTPALMASIRPPEKAASGASMKAVSTNKKGGK